MPRRPSGIGRWVMRSKLMQPQLPLLLPVLLMYMYLLPVKRLKLLLPELLLLLLLLHPLPLLLSQHPWAVAHLGFLLDNVDITWRELVCVITFQLIWEYSNKNATLRTVSMSLGLYLRKSAGTLLERVSVTIKLLEHATRSILTYPYVELHQASS